MNIKKDDIVIFSIVLTTLASAGDLYFNFTQHLTIGLEPIDILMRVIVLTVVSLIFIFIYKVFCNNSNELVKKVIKYLIAIPLCFSLIFVAGFLHNPSDIESEIKFRAQRNKPIQIAISENKAMKELDHKRKIEIMEKEESILRLQIRLLELENEAKSEEVNNDSISN